MKTQLRIFLIFAIIFFASFIPENYRSFFGDWLCQGSIEYVKDSMYFKGCNYMQSGFHTPEWHWGFRHYIWILMGLTMTGFNIYKIADNQNK